MKRTSGNYIEHEINELYAQINSLKETMQRTVLSGNISNLIIYNDMMEKYEAKLKKLEGIQDEIQKESNLEIRQGKDEIERLKVKLDMVLRAEQRAGLEMNEKRISAGIQRQIKALQDKIDKINSERKAPDSAEQLLNRPMHEDVKNIKSKRNYQMKRISSREEAGAEKVVCPDCDGSGRLVV